MLCSSHRGRCYMLHSTLFPTGDQPSQLSSPLKRPPTKFFSSTTKPRHLFPRIVYSCLHQDLHKDKSAKFPRTPTRNIKFSVTTRRDPILGGEARPRRNPEPRSSS